MPGTRYHWKQEDTDMSLLAQWFQCSVCRLVTGDLSFFLLVANDINMSLQCPSWKSCYEGYSTIYVLCLWSTELTCLHWHRKKMSCLVCFQASSGTKRSRSRSGSKGRRVRRSSDRRRRSHSHSRDHRHKSSRSEVCTFESTISIFSKSHFLSAKKVIKNKI